MSSKTVSSISKNIGSGITPLRSNAEFWDNPKYHWLKTEQLGEFEIYDTAEYISQVALNETSIKLWPANTISVAMYGEGKTRGRVSIVAKQMATNQACCNIEVDESEADYRYLYYWLKGKYEALRVLSSGVRKNLNSEDIKTFPFPNHGIKTQKDIANVLYCIDKKIQLNSKINEELEAIAKTLYDYWFVQFDFPNEDGDPYKSTGGVMVYSDELKREIPKGWRTRKVKDILNVVTGKEDANFALANGSYKFFTCAQTSLQCDGYAFDGSAVLIAGNGDFNVKHYTGKFNAYQRTYVLIPNEKYYGTLYIVANDLIQQFKKGSNGSIVKFITKGDVENITIINPSDNTYFERINEIIFSMELKSKENEDLMKLRDWLLPMLMNGQVTVK